MPKFTEKTCPKCGQMLRFPNDVGGIMMRCPSCGKEFPSDFKVGTINKCQQPGLPSKVFAMPMTILNLISRALRKK